ncbi:MAG: hypothetical protein A2887_03235 [Alphaproteobacteria bacterium RIFCSPLOWO2_01_FULL_40_26]|nr:MAG: hypothetical protein A3D15_02285 [Alphaproteobacteria bacterium RIFCSPHIGHO2_02_FULL_40_34]OFW86277.1 MAG: hypothetical protein A2794_05480 [Alphaproteobacteria bacterium RIFCSPHIGHO2_01_FULL_40_8]OFW95539.1 MAG: hypothetical protein A2887_03235 [Alphaproteobacteria bacterium RIFCSPLOWO2_01_FULL_40_26]OFX09621.1 MAG: hypothetical protein A3H30_05150 [Alphaproteobacteria bacterium RIFCSPLOWO2_02_FULL_40_19]OFX11334.1 MAG: hypothetical protein A3G22_05455 [Alphaproteobacteria bacterium RI
MGEGTNRDWLDALSGIGVRTCPKSFLTPYFALFWLIFCQNFSKYVHIFIKILAKKRSKHDKIWG